MYGNTLPLEFRISSTSVPSFPSLQYICIFGVEIGVILEEQPHDSLVPSRGGPHQRRRAIVVFYINIGVALLEQLLRDDHLPSLSGMR